MVDPSTHSALGQRLADRTAPLAPDDDLNGYAHAALCEGMMLPFAQLAELVDPPDPLVPWEPLFDVDICPGWALPWLAQIVGVRIPANISDADARILIKQLGSFGRGGPEAIRSAAQFGLTGNKTVLFRERDAGDPYLLEIVVLASECPDLATVQRLVLTQKPGGIKLNLRTVVGWDYEQMKTAFVGKKYKDIPPLYPTYRFLAAGPF